MKANRVEDLKRLREERAAVDAELVAARAEIVRLASALAVESELRVREQRVAADLQGALQQALADIRYAAEAAQRALRGGGVA